ncbi:MAG: ribokinase [Dokdonella sp.]
MHSRGSVVVVGSYVQDHAWLCDVFPQVGETRRATGFNTGPGGKGFNQAIACRRQGVDTVFIGAIGADALGKAARDFADAEQLDARWQMCSDAPTASSSIVVNAHGENLIVVNLAANEWLDPEFVRAQLAGIDAPRVLLCQLENNLDAIAAALDAASDPDCLRVLNPAPMHSELNLGLLRRVDVLTPNETEFSLMSKCCGFDDVDADAIAQLSDNELHALVRRLPLGSSASSTCVITLGAHGCFVSHGEKRHGDVQAYYRIAAESVTAIDSTGAGDAFSGALAAGLVEFSNAPFADIVQHANRVAAMSTETIGTAPAMPTRVQVEARFGCD